jgi:hypothetical protein
MLRILNCIPSRDQSDDWTIASAMEAGLMKAPALPTSVDLRERWWKVADQEATGSCVGWATADSVLRWHFVQAGWLRENQKLSVRYVWMASKETDEFATRATTFIEAAGTSLKAALDVARRFGVVPDSILPFRPSRLYQGDTRTFYALASRYRIASYFNLGQDPDEWRMWLANNGPILTRLDVDSTWMSAKRTKGRLKTYRASTAHGGHACALVGYTKSGFIVRNSWGEDWGDQGFGHASHAYARAAFDEAYGVVV